MVLSIIALATGLTDIVYIQAVHGISMNSDKDPSLQFPNRVATLIVIKNVTTMPINESDTVEQVVAAYGVILSANDFLMHVNGNNPSPFEFADQNQE